MTLMNAFIGFGLFLMLSFCETHKILVVSHLPIKSHAVLNHVLVKLLLDAGHEVKKPRQYVIAGS